jgi:predicted nucleotidyltransferase
VESDISYRHKVGRGQSWASADRDVRDYIRDVVEIVRAILEPNGFVGAYLHGSLAMGSFYRPKSDIDLLLVVKQGLTPEQRRNLALRLCELSDARPVLGDLEVSVLRETETQHFHHPLPHELHYSAYWKQHILADKVDYATGGTDGDLAAHCASMRARGMSLAGRPIEKVFGPVPIEDTRRSILADLDDIMSDGVLSVSPVYGVLNACRVLALQAQGWSHVISKDEGGEWALRHLPEPHRRVVAQALSCYRSSETVTPELKLRDGHDWDQDALDGFGAYIRATVEV